MNILLTNDDGYNAIGINILKDKLSKYGRVVVVAPVTHMSGKSVSITIGEWQKVEEIEKDVYAVHGTPADCVSWALYALSGDFDLVVSGCNNGHNLSFDTLFSGTVGAALTALIDHKKCICFSAPFDDFSVLENEFDNIWKFIFNNNLLSDKYLLNINLPRNESKGIKLGRLSYRNDYYYYERNGDQYYALRNLDDMKDLTLEDDHKQVREGYVSIVPISRLPFDESTYQELLKKVNK